MELLDCRVVVATGYRPRFRAFLCRAFNMPQRRLRAINESSRVDAAGLTFLMSAWGVVTATSRCESPSPTPTLARIGALLIAKAQPVQPQHVRDSPFDGRSIATPEQMVEFELPSI